MKLLLALSIFIVSLPVKAAVSSDAALERCRAEQNALRRLACYDGINVANSTVATETTKSTEALAQAEAALGPMPVTPPQQNFGLEHKQVNDDSEQELTVIVQSVSYSPRKELIIDFTNGQRWRQVGSGRYNIDNGEEHLIKRGILNSFFLANKQNNRTIKIKREK